MGLCFSDCEPHNDYHGNHHHCDDHYCDDHTQVVRERYCYGDAVCSDGVCNTPPGDGVPPVYICDSPRLQYYSAACGGYQNPAGFTVYEEDSGYAEAFLSSGVPEYQEPPPPAYSSTNVTALSVPPPTYSSTGPPPYNPAYLRK